MLVLIFAVITVDDHHITCQLFADHELALSYTQGWLNDHGFSTGQVTRTGDTWTTPIGTIQLKFEQEFHNFNRGRNALY